MVRAAEEPAAMIDPDSLSTPSSLYEIETPAMVVDLDVLEHNISTLAAAFENVPAVVRPHVKNHKCPDIAKLQIAAGAQGVTCATVREAHGMFHGGVSDILIANEVVGPAKIARLIRLASDGANIKVAVDSKVNARELSQAAVAAETELGILVDLDVGLDRCGVEPGEQAVELARTVDSLPGLNFLGLMAFDGHVGNITEPEGRSAACRDAMQLAVDTKRMVKEAGIACPVLSASSSKSYDTALEFPDVTEVQAGMYLFMDTTYRARFPDVPFRQAAFVLATVISRRGDRAVADGGIKALTGFRGVPTIRDRDDCEPVGLSAEHLSLDLTPDSDLAIGDLLWMAPAYGDGLSAIHSRIYAIRDGAVEHVWPISN